QPPKISNPTIQDCTLGADLFPHMDQRMTVPWGNHSLPKENPALQFAPNYHGEEGKLVQAVRHFNIAENEVAYADMTIPESLHLNTTKASSNNYQQVQEEIPTRVRKRSGLEQYVASLANQRKTSHHMIENREEEDEKEDNSRKSSLNNKSSLHNNLNSRTSEDSINDNLYESYSPLIQLDPETINDIQNNDKQCTSVNKKPPRLSRQLTSQDSVDDTEEKGRQRKTSLLHLVNPFIPFQNSNTETEHPITPKEGINEQTNFPSTDI
ncbi:unnamed protein product, partial [Meganyctiphanes norvegica]